MPSVPHKGAKTRWHVGRSPGLRPSQRSTAAGYEYKTREQGAATSVMVAASRLLEGVSGRYFADCNEAPVVDSSSSGPPRGFGVASYALDPADATRLW
jgi:hypothetical protein